MASVDTRVIKTLLSAPSEAEYWLVGWDHTFVVSLIPNSISYTEALLLLPGGLKLIGKSFNRNTNQDYLSISKDLNISPAIFLTKSEDKILAQIVELPMLYQKEISIKTIPSFLTLYSKSTIPLFALDSTALSFFDSQVLFSVNSNLLYSTEGSTWSSLGVKNKNLVPVEVYFEVTTVNEGHAPCLEVNPITRAYSVIVNWCSIALESSTVGDALEMHLAKLRNIMASIIRSLQTFPTKSASCYCFLNDFIRHPINVVYLYEEWNEDSVELESQRKKVHEVFDMPQDWPLVRSACAIKELEGFRDVHLSLIESKALDVGVKSAVKGHLAYFHYAQDGFDDKGWGCAYRSLQTLISWLKEQHLFHQEIPSHYQIQKYLVELGDKPKEFIGSKEWIGAYEVMLVLDSYCKVPCKILNFSSGSEFINKGRELFSHFSNEGSPVMIGGGVLAYTLLGVDYNEDTGKCRYLILDPHYVGSDNLGVVLSKGWCAWKGPEIFRSDCFYNLCMPLRPRYI